ncbi:adenine deaminase [Methanoregula formicica]|uniref:Adenine deaminase n=1 Tax=Methanoregula formicica (strain DSM 22288 / NBRC 105244 / SMSP) TaxID=593750 RepID=L0HD87_METFS|nr:adenine deaminase [Methanoregula formicica]AGB02667.1 adenine deaminase [Methanoregula formicica SMSP]
MTPFCKPVIDAARGMGPADVIFEDATIFNPFTCSWDEGTLAVKDGIVLGTGDYEGNKTRNCSGKYLVPGLIDAHVHIESSLLRPSEYARLVALHGTGTVIADPHEIANIAGEKGLEYMLAAREGAAVDILYMLPSCVPATPADVGGAVLDAGSLRQFVGREGILGLGEMMNFPGVLSADPGVGEKIALAGIRDGHAPMLSGKDLNAYILAGLQSDHECTTFAEAEEKLRNGMYIFVREGSTEKNIEALLPLVTEKTVSRCCFATDDCHADLLMEDGHIDRCIRKAVVCGLMPELAIRMATLSPAERFGLHDRGALSPGRRADFCMIDDPEKFVVQEVFRNGTAVTAAAPVPAAPFPPSIRCRPPQPEAIQVSGSGRARVIGLVPGQIVTEALTYQCSAAGIPDRKQDIQKVVVCNRYHNAPPGLGLVHGFGFWDGAIACSISHDAHNIVATGTSDDAILQALREVVRSQGGMVAACGNEMTVLPLDCAGLMSTLPYNEVADRLKALHKTTDRIGGIDNPFMYLSFLALTVIPALRVTDRGVFDGVAFRDVPLFDA